jgi:hypothetical protein
MFSIHPFAAWEATRPIAILGAVLIGSSGTGSARNDRFTGGLGYEGERFGIMGSFTWAMGIQDDPTREAALAEVFVRGEPVRNLLLGARGSYFLRDVRVEESRVVTVLVSGGYRIPMPRVVAAFTGPTPLEAHLALVRSAPGGVARVEDPESDFWEGRLIARVVY